MSNRASYPSVGGTLAGGIQDVSAILPLIGTEQCEKHVGSALTGGYLYAAATPLSIFGSLGVIKAGVTILISSISISLPSISMSFREFKPSMTYYGQRKWFGGRFLKDAGFELTGTVAPLIGMDGYRFRAESRLVEMLEEKHLDNPEKVSVDWKSRHWNLMLALFTIFAAVLSTTPYIALFLGHPSWRPSGIRFPWLFPALRIVGTCAATVTCQFIIQSRVVSLMKNRIIWMAVNRRVNATPNNIYLKSPHIQWNANLPAEQCLSDLEKYLFSTSILIKQPEECKGPQDQGAIQNRQDTDASHISVPILTPREDQIFNNNDLRRLQQEHFPNPIRDAGLVTFAWIMLGLSLPATVAGYIGCFTLVSATSTTGNGPLVWVGLEAALSMLRIVIWAFNPSFDEETEVTLGLKLSEHQPMVTTNDYNPHITTLNHEERKPFDLVPESEFLQQITPFTGPLDQIQKADNITLYFTLTSDYDATTNSQIGSGLTSADVRSDSQSESEAFYDVCTRPDYGCLYMTVFDFNMQIGVTLVSSNLLFNYFDVAVKYDVVSRKLRADVRSEKKETHTWRIEDDSLFDSLEKYYKSIVHALNQRNRGSTTATLPWQWNLSPKPVPAIQGDNTPQTLLFPSLTTQDQSYLDRGYEHQLKTGLLTKWGDWIFMDLWIIRASTRLDCHEALKDATSVKGQWELSELDEQLAIIWTSRELVLPALSLTLEDILRTKMVAFASENYTIRQDEQLRAWMYSEFESGRRTRMEREREDAKKRMTNAMKSASEEATREGRPWRRTPLLSPQWAEVIQFIDNLWLAGIDGRLEDLWRAEDKLQEILNSKKRPTNRERDDFLDLFRKRVFHEHWRPQHNFEIQMMKETIERIHLMPRDGTRDSELYMAYEYPLPDNEATSKFAHLAESSTVGTACSATVYDAEGCDSKVVCEVIAKPATRSVINVDPQILPSIPPNNHLLSLSCNGGKGGEPPFVEQNRRRWWNLQTTNSSTFYFSPLGVDNYSCYSYNKTIAHILVLITVPSTVFIHVVHRGGDGSKVSIREDLKVLGVISGIPSNSKLHIQTFQPFELEHGMHELELVCQGFYALRDIVVKFCDA